MQALIYLGESTSVRPSHDNITNYTCSNDKLYMSGVEITPCVLSVLSPRFPIALLTANLPSTLGTSCTSIISPPALSIRSCSSWSVGLCGFVVTNY